MIQPRDFTGTEISEINKYILTNVPHSKLTQLYALSENIMTKSWIYITMFRIIYGCYDYVEKPETKEKLKKLIDENKDLYTKIYALIQENENNSLNFGKRNILLKLKHLYQDFESNFAINRLVDIFLVFAEKINMIRTDSFVSINIETKEGEEAYKKIVAAYDKRETPLEEVMDEEEFDEESELEEEPDNEQETEPQNNPEVLEEEPKELESPQISP